MRKSEDFFSYFSLTSEQKYRYAQMRLVGEAYGWLEDTYINCRCLLVLQELLRAQYAPHILYASEADYREPDVVESEPKDVEHSETESAVKEPEPEIEELPIETLVDLPTAPP